MASLEKAVVINTVSGARHEVMFNPEEYSINQDNNYASMGIPGLSGPLLQFVHGNARTLEMELFFDTYEENRRGAAVVNKAESDVRVQVRKFVGLLEIEPSTHAPPVVEFHWGTLHFRGVLTRASQKYTMFLATGVPVRARVQVSFQEYINSELEDTGIRRETVDYTKRHQVGLNESLSAIAAREYDNPELWREIAAHNGIDNPAEVTAGTWLALPRLPLDDFSLIQLEEGRPAL